MLVVYTVHNRLAMWQPSWNDARALPHLNLAVFHVFPLLLTLDGRSLLAVLATLALLATLATLALLALLNVNCPVLRQHIN